MSEAAHPYVLMALNNGWANETLYRAVSALSQSEFTARRPGFFPSLAKTLHHIYTVDLYYIDALEAGGLGDAARDHPELADSSDLADAQAEADRRLIAFCRSLTRELLSEERVTERAEGDCKERVDGLLLHLFQHQVHHRGQAHVQLQEAGVAPPQLDEFHIAYDRAPTATAWFS